MTTDRTNATTGLGPLWRVAVAALFAAAIASFAHPGVVKTVVVVVSVVLELWHRTGLWQR